MSYNLPEPGNGDSVAHDHTSPLIAKRSPQNVYALNVLLGLGVLAALLTSIWVFGGFTSNRQTQLLTSPRGFNFRLFSTTSLLFEGKMVALIAIAFGAGMILFMQRRDEGKLSRADLFIRRQFWLIVLGVLNAIIFFWTQDILFHLGIMGILLFAFYRVSPKGLLLASLITTLFFAGKHYWNYADDQKAYRKYVAVLVVEKKFKQDSIARATKKDTSATAKAAAKNDTLTKKQSEEKGAWEGIVKSSKYDAKRDEGTMKAMRAHNYEKLYDHLLPAAQTREAQWTYRIGIWDLASMMFLGMALFGWGFFSGRLSTLQYFMVALTLIGAGLLLGWYRFYFQIESIRDYQKYVINRALPYNILFPFEQWLMALGYAGGVMGFIKSGVLKPVLKCFNAVGRMAITNYFLQSIVCGLVFTGFGMGYFGSLSQVELYFLVFEIWIVQVVFSVFWLRRFQEGPVEWLWRCLTYRKWDRIKRYKTPDQSEPSPIVL